MSDSGKAVFLSYASQDAEAAKRICDALRAAGVEVWFDQSELVGGDAWDQKIRKQIKDCALLIPIISENTQQRTEGYFRLEWRLADQRTHLMAKGRAFLLPVVIDDTPDADAAVPDSFLDVQWTRLRPIGSAAASPPGGEDPVLAKFVARVKDLLSADPLARAKVPRFQGQWTEGRTNNPEPTTHNRRLGRLWWALPIFGVMMALLLVMKQTRKEPAPNASNGSPVVPPSAIPAPSEAQKLVAQARQIFENADEYDREKSFLAEDLVKRALVLDPAEPAAWELAGTISHAMVWFSLDNSLPRRELLMQQAARAGALAPGSVPAQLLQANARLAVFGFASAGISAATVLGDLEREVLELAQREPGNAQVQRTLGTVERFLNKPEEALRALRRAVELSGGNPRARADLVNVLLRFQRFEEAEAVVAAGLKVRQTSRLLTFDAFLKLRWRGDIPAAQAALQTWPGWLLREDRGAFFAWQIWFFSRKPAEALNSAQVLQHDYLRETNFIGPRAVLTARAHEMAGHREAARADWRAVVQRCDRELAEASDDTAALYWKAWALARLEDLPAARAICTILQQRSAVSRVSFFKGTPLAALLATVGDTDAALADLTAESGSYTDAYSFSRAFFELDPSFDGLRDNPQFRAIVEAAPAPGKQRTPSSAKPLEDKTEDRGQRTVQAAEDKSVAVLAFANLSDDKANEYFSDGISEELLNVLAKIPGLKVAARTSAFYFKGKEVPVPEIAKQLGVAYVVEGSVRKSGDKVRITAQLIKAADGFHVWSDTFTRDIKDVFAVQDEIAGLIAKNLELKIGVGQSVTRQAVSPEAYQEFLVGRAAAARASMADLGKAVGHFERAVALEPKYTAAWVQLASAHTRLGRWGGAPTLSSWASARAAIDQALALEPDSPDVLLALGWILRTAEWDWRGAERAFRRALAQQPNNPEILAGTAVLLFNIGRMDEAFRLARQAVQLDPLNPSTQIDLSIMFFESRNWVESERAARRALQLAPEGTSYHSVLAWPLINQGRYAEAEAELILDTDMVQQTGTHGLLALARGDKAKVRELLARLEDLARTQPDRADLQTCTAWLHAGLGDKDRAFAALEKARASRDPSMAWLRDNTELTPLFSDPRWDALLRQVGLADEQLR